MDVEKSYERSIARMELDTEIYCPYFHYLQSQDDGNYPITYHGEDEVEMECESCGKNFVVQENVERTYTVRTATGEEQYASDMEGLIEKKIEERQRRSEKYKKVTDI